MSEKDMEYIRVAAYFMWENAGKPEGKDEEFWWKACDEFACCSSKGKSLSAKKAPAKKACSKTLAKPAVKIEAKPAAKAAVKAPAKKTVKTKISPVPVKTASKIITPLYGSLKK